MFPPTPPSAADDAEFLEVWAEAIGAAPASFARFMELALYHPHLGYYRRKHQRVGLDARADFYTASSTGPIFGELVTAAAVKLLGPHDAGRFDFIELGSESEGGVLAGVAHPFRSARTVRLGEPLQPTGDCVVFSNELFDAQPFHRLVHRGGVWCECGVGRDAGRLVEVELPVLSPPVAAIRNRLPESAPEGYRLDLPLAAADLCGQIARAPWRGLFLAFDYGKPWASLATDTPNGSARAYRTHRQERDLLAHPGRQDLTCHICWDWLETALRDAGCTDIRVDSQEAFFVRYAGEAAARIVAGARGRPDPLRSRLHELLHPGLLGQRFQVLHARR